MELFDTHVHLLSERFDQDRDELIPTLADAGVAYVLEACCSEEDMPRIAELCARYSFVYGSAGIHPHEASTATPQIFANIAKMLEADKIVAVGEIGLDYHYDFSPRDVQRQVFTEQIELAKAANKPIIVHDREAHGDCMALLRARRDGLEGVMHCYSGSYEDAVKYIDMGLYIAFGGALTFKNAVNQRDMAGRLPIDRLVIETDCPYMTPEPHRGKRNDPTLLHFTLEKLAEVQGLSVEETAAITTANAKRLFRIS